MDTTATPKRNLEKTIPIIFRMLAQIEKITDSEINRTIFNTKKPTNREFLTQNFTPNQNGDPNQNEAPNQAIPTPEDFKILVQNHLWADSWQESIKKEETQNLVSQALKAGEAYEKILADFLEKRRILRNTPQTKLSQPENSPEKTNCAKLLHSLGENDPKSSQDNLDKVRRTEAITQLRSKIVERFLTAASEEFEGKSEQEISKTAEALKKFLSAAQEKETYYCQREGVIWGTKEFKRSSHTKLQAGKVPDEFLDVANCLAQICIGNRKNLLPQGNENDALTAAKAFVKVKHLKSEAIFPELYEERAKVLYNLPFAPNILKDIEEIFEKFPLDEPSKSTLQREISLFNYSLQKLGTDFDIYDQLHRKEIEAFKNISKIHKALTKSKTQNLDQFKGAKNKLEKKMRLEKLEAFLAKNPLEKEKWEKVAPKTKWENYCKAEKDNLQTTLQRLLNQRHDPTKPLKETLSNLLPERNPKSDIQKKETRSTIKTQIQKIRDAQNNPNQKEEIKKSIRETLKELRKINKKIEETSLNEEDYNEILKNFQETDIKAQIFHAIHKEQPGTEAAPTFILINKLYNNKKWVSQFLKQGPSALYTSPESKGLFSLYNAANPTLAISNKSNPDEVHPLTNAFKQLELADAALSHPKIQKLLDEKTQIEAAAINIHQNGITSETATKRLEKTLCEIKEKAEVLSQSLSKELEGVQKSIETLPKLLKNKGEQDRAEASLIGLLGYLCKPNFINSLQTVEEELLQSLSEKTGVPKEEIIPAIKNSQPIDYQRDPDRREVSILRSSNALPTDHLPQETKKEVINIIELLSTTQSLKTLSALEETRSDEKNFEHLMKVLTHKTPPKSPQDHAFVSLCDSVALNGVKVKTMDIIYRVLKTKNYSTNSLKNEDIEELGTKIRSDLLSLKEWREQETGVTTINFLETNFQGYQKETNPKEIALALCKTPTKLKELLREDLKIALKNCLFTKIWKRPEDISPKNTSARNAEYLFMINSYKEKEPELVEVFKQLHQTTIQLEKTLQDDHLNKKRALAWHFKPKERLKTLFETLNTIEHNNLTPKSIEEIKTWFPNQNSQNLAKMLLSNPSLLQAAKEMQTQPKKTLLALENKALEKILAAKNPEPGIKYLQAWNNALGHHYYYSNETRKPNKHKEDKLQDEENKTQDEEDKLQDEENKLQLISEGLQNKIFNLIELSKRIGQVAKKPEALANTYIQQIEKQNRIHRQKNLEERLLKLQYAMKKSPSQEDLENLNKLKETLKQLQNANSCEDWARRAKNQEEEIKNTIYAKNQELRSKEKTLDETNWTEVENGDEHKRRARQRIRQDRRQILQLKLKKNRLAELIHITNTLKENPSIQTIASSLVESPVPQSFGDALQKALKTAFTLANNPTALELATIDTIQIPKTADIYDMLEASHLQEKMDQIRTTLTEAGYIIGQYHEKARNIDYSEENLKTITKKLQNSAFECLKVYELDSWSKGAKQWNPRSFQEQLIEQNPSLIEAKKQWHEELRNAEQFAQELSDYIKTDEHELKETKI